MLSCLFVLHSLGCVFHILGNLVANISVVMVLIDHSIFSFIMLVVDGCDRLDVVLKVRSKSCLSFAKKHVDFSFNLGCKTMVLLNRALFSKDGLITSQLHLDLLLLDVLNFFDVVLLLHFALPADKLARVFQAHLHLCQFFGVSTLFFIDQVFLTFQHRHIKLHISLIF